MRRISRSQSEVQPGAVVLGEPLLKRALSRREKHEVLFGAAVLALGSDRALKQQPVIDLQYLRSPKRHKIFIFDWDLVWCTCCRCWMHWESHSCGAWEMLRSQIERVVNCRRSQETGASNCWMHWVALLAAHSPQLSGGMLLLCIHQRWPLGGVQQHQTASQCREQRGVLL